MPFIDKYLENPTIKLSPPILLNDPFETQSTQSVVEYIYKTYKDEYQLSDLEENKYGDQRRRAILTTVPMKIIRSSGICSLSESNRSLLMWAHYANQHKGMVLGLEDDFLIPNTDQKVTPKFIYSPKPIKVKYDTVRFDVSEFDKGESNIVNVSRLLAMKMLTTKSDDWLYEKEYRSILPIGMADEIHFKGTKDCLGNDLGNILYKYFKENDFSIDFETENNPVHISSKIEITHKLYRRISENEKFIFLKRINPKKINSIYFGVRTSNANILSVIKTIDENKEKLGHIKLYEYKLCNRQFTLIKDEIDWRDKIDTFNSFKKLT